MTFDFLSGINALGGGVVGYLVPFLFVLTLVVFFHELGHFLVARRCGVRVLVFSIGFGPELFGFNDRHDTRWKVSAIPLGGYVKFFGDENAASVPDPVALAAMTEEERRHSFVHQPVARRAAIVVAGPLANFVLAIAIFAALFMVFGKPSTSPRVDAVQPGSAAEAAGFKPGDLVLAINGRSIESFPDMQQIVSTSAGETLEFEVDRGGLKVALKATPTLRESKDRFGNVHRIGVLGITRSSSPEDTHFRPVGPVKAFELGVQRTWFVVERTLSYIGGVISGREAADQLGGPIRIAQVSGQVATEGLPSLFSLAAVLSVSIGLLNLFPVPLLDGGHLLFYGIEAARGRPLSERAQEVGFRIGLAIVVMLMIFATYNDLLHLAAQWTAS
ncbi:MAG TPA: RIP metalloprotease RseP [Xanthobacteraceae bacterium]|nr:RIP metalloprotease RseP [Xanthobacteraceae bacterium]